MRISTIQAAAIRRAEKHGWTVKFQCIGNGTVVMELRMSPIVEDIAISSFGEVSSNATE